MIIDGKKIASGIVDEIRDRVKQFKRKPAIAFLLVGENPASETYVSAKKRACSSTGISSTVIKLPASVAEEHLLKEIARLNKDHEIDGILVQLPLPAHIDEKKITYAIDPEKDVDGFHPVNVGKMLLGDESGFLSCTPNGIKILLEKSEIPISGKHVVIVGRSNIVGKPLAAILMQKKKGCNATVTIAHSQSVHLNEICRTADILIAAIGQPRFIGKEMIKPGAVVIDVGINRIDGKIVGDVDFDAVLPVVSEITPVPGGVGPMTIAMLLKNTVKSYENHLF